MKNKLLIIGAGGHGKVVCDIAKKYYKEVVFADNNKKGQSVLGCPVLFTTQEALNSEPCDFIVAIGSNEIREKVFYTFINARFTPVSIVHESAVIGEGVEIGRGSVVFAGAIINPDSKIGIGCILNTSSSVDHDCNLGNFTHLCPDSHFAGTVTVGDKCTFGVGSCVINNVEICSNVVVGAGGIVVRNIEQSGLYVGLPAKKIKEI